MILTDQHLKQRQVSGLLTTPTSHHNRLEMNSENCQKKV
jgi:hypothetical protein